MKYLSGLHFFLMRNFQLTNLSPAAQAVLDAVVSHSEFATRKRTAAAFRAVVHGIDYITSEEILAIADELEGAN